MIVSDVKSSLTEDFAEISAICHSEKGEKREFPLRFRFFGWDQPLAETGDSFLASLLIPCMYADENLRIEAPVSQRLLDSSDKAQELFSEWFPEFERRTIIAPKTHGRFEPTLPERKGVFFSLGSDSWYSTLKHLDELTDLFLIDSLDTSRREIGLWERTHQAAIEAARKIDKRLIIIKTNLRRQIDLSRKDRKWGKRYTGFFWRPMHGTALAATGLNLQGSLSTLYIPSTLDNSNLIPYGSHPHLDPLWSTENMEIVHDGCEYDRMGKIQTLIAKSPAALESLRVCLEYPITGINCCHCEKCMRTMICLRLSGVLDQATSFEKPLDLRRLRRHSISPKDDWYAPLYQKLYEAAKAKGDMELAESLEVTLGKRKSIDRVYGRIRNFVGHALVAVTPHSYQHVTRKIVGPLSKDPIIVKNNRETS